MKLICLNIWGGKIYEPLMKFVREQAESTDIFCFQEVFRSPRKDIETSHETRINLLDELSAALPDFNYVFHPTISGFDVKGPVDFEIEMGQAEFVKKSIPIISSGEIPIFPTKEGLSKENEEFYPENFGYVRIKQEDSVLSIINLHGLTSGADKKLDCPERITQSRITKEFAAKEKSDVIICGDFNIMPEEKSITTFDDSFVNLIKKYEIQRTKGKLSYWYGNSDELKFSDYVFVPPSLKISDFKVPALEISDHLPLVMEFS